MIITLLRYKCIAYIQENPINKQTRGMSTSQQQMVSLLVIMQRSKLFAYSQFHGGEKKQNNNINNKQTQPGNSQVS